MVEDKNLILAGIFVSRSSSCPASGRLVGRTVPTMYSFSLWAMPYLRIKKFYHRASREGDQAFGDSRQECQGRQVSQAIWAFFACFAFLARKFLRVLREFCGEDSTEPASHSSGAASGGPPDFARSSTFTFSTLSFVAAFVIRSR